ncbi:MAG: hypothetical protein M1819_001163 [Sarea resinae]|nr:MAG: hypothetical protein M1819_001163 [Sarea resinae]
MSSNAESPPSSPDPLGDSSEVPSFRSPQKTTSRSPIRKSPLKEVVTGSNQSIRLQDFVLNTPPANLDPFKPSPTKSSAQTENVLSPWRIRVTVEAEREQENEGPALQINRLRVANATSPSKGPKMRTTTTTVPLKGLDSSPVAPKRRGRPRKSASPAKRTGTPAPKSRGRRKSVVDPVDVQLEKDTPGKTPSPVKRRGRPRKSNAPSDLDRLDRPNTAIEDGRDEHTYSTSNNAETDKVLPESNHSPAEVADETMWRAMVRNDEESMNNEGRIHESSNEAEEENDALGDLREFDSVLESEGFSMVSISSIPSAREFSSSPSVRESSIQSRPPSPDNGAPGFSEESAKSSSQPLAGKLIPSKAKRAERPVSDIFQSLALEQHDSEKHPSNESVRQTEASMLSHMGSSPPVAEHPSLLFPQRTPSMELSSPSLPPPLRQTSSKAAPAPKEMSTPKLSGVVRAGIALQGVLDTKTGLQSPLGSPIKESHSPKKEQKERLDDLFSGFGQSTRRELRAGLRLGEELARRQREAAARRESNNRGKTGGLTEEREYTGYPRLPTPDEQKLPSAPLPDVIEYPQLQSEKEAPGEVDDEDEMVWQRGSPAQLSKPQDDQNIEEEAGEAGNITACSTTSQLEAKWQREREAVSQRIAAANTSQVIVIDSSSSEEESDVGSTIEGKPADPELEDEHDIWQAEARESSEITASALPQTHDLWGTDTEIIKPRRSKIPSPWRNKNQIIYSDEPQEDEEDGRDQTDAKDERNDERAQLGTNPTEDEDSVDVDESGLFWQSTRRIREQREMRQRRQERKNEIDLSALLGLKGSNEERVVPDDSKVGSGPRREGKMSEFSAQETVQEPSKLYDVNFVSPARQIEAVEAASSAEKNTLGHHSSAIHDESSSEISFAPSLCSTPAPPFSSVAAQRQRQLKEALVEQRQEQQKLPQHQRHQDALQSRLLGRISAASGGGPASWLKRRQASPTTVPSSASPASSTTESRSESVATLATAATTRPSTSTSTSVSASASAPERKQTKQHENQSKASKAKEVKALPTSGPWLNAHYKLLDSLYQASKEPGWGQRQEQRRGSAASHPLNHREGEKQDEECIPITDPKLRALVGKRYSSYTTASSSSSNSGQAQGQAQHQGQGVQQQQQQLPQRKEYTVTLTEQHVRVVAAFLATLRRDALAERQRRAGPSSSQTRQPEPKDDCDANIDGSIDIDVAFSEKQVAKRLFSLVAGETLRAERARS